MTHRSLVPIGLLALALLLGACRPAPTSLEELPTVSVPIPTPTATPTPAPTHTPTPEGWQQKRDPVTGTPFLAPPPAERAAILAAFRAVLGCIHLIAETQDVLRMSPQQLLQHRQAVAAQFQAAMMDPSWWEWCAEGKTDALWVVPERHWSPEQVWCDTPTTCEVTRIQIGPATAAVIYDPQLAAKLGIKAPGVSTRVDPKQPFIL